MLVLLVRLVMHTSYRLVLRTTLADSIREINSYTLMSIESWVTPCTSIGTIAAARSTKINTLLTRKNTMSI